MPNLIQRHCLSLAAKFSLCMFVDVSVPSKTCAGLERYKVISKVYSICILRLCKTFLRLVLHGLLRRFFEDCRSRRYERHSSFSASVQVLQTGCASNKTELQSLNVHASTCTGLEWSILVFTHLRLEVSPVRRFQLDTSYFSLQPIALAN